MPQSTFIDPMQIDRNNLPALLWQDPHSTPRVRAVILEEETGNPVIAIESMHGSDAMGAPAWDGDNHSWPAKRMLRALLADVPMPDWIRALVDNL